LTKKTSLSKRIKKEKRETPLEKALDAVADYSEQEAKESSKNDDEGTIYLDVLMKMKRGKDQKLT
jgi:hypothetical protein